MENKVSETKDKLPKRSKKKIALGIVLFLVVVGICFGCYYYFDSVNYISTDNAKVTTDLKSVYPLSAGRVVRWDVKEGDQVGRNQVIGRLSNGSYLRAPIDGEVVETSIEVGQYVSTANKAAVIAATNDVYINANIEENMIAKICKGQAVKVELDAYPGQNFLGYVTNLDSVTLAAMSGSSTSFSTGGTYTKVTQLFPVEIRLEESSILNTIIGTNAFIKINVGGDTLDEETLAGIASSAAMDVNGTIIEAAGKIIAKDSEDIVLDFPAMVNTIEVDNGDVVTAGDTLMTFDLTDSDILIQSRETSLAQLNQQLASLRSTLAAAQTNLTQQQSNLEMEANSRETIQILEDDVKHNEELVARAQDNYDKTLLLYNAGATAKIELDNAQQKLDDANYALSSMQLTLESSTIGREQSIESLKVAISQQQASIDSTQASIESQNLQIQQAETELENLRANRDSGNMEGYALVCDMEEALVQNISRVKGDYIPANSTVVNLVDLDSLVIVAEVTEDYIKDVGIGDVVEIYTLRDHGKTYTGHVSKISAVGTEKNNEVIIETEIIIDNPDEGMRPNYSVDVRIVKGV
ncbi:Multidrug resistance efflux pump [Dethiosulfatibacter aminovorans DSM 17477]|uniref:Multidrug resistance efflux pump n=1 Tax=Dethiosulfatibacter aminovorans DSM 17477 TaxID=1121476 RepID=A0A1M6GAM2_9FIRM|nr:efflux RND transporter periplasmic adaptor subunit [Dethiosulfatibacter aminovorans]SHJ07006.1 Multidrug resistance efflux pump [Dethiosulfatibacter aminovorans DSM 17477]